jgi:putative RNA 2'-phosphotransferase
VFKGRRLKKQRAYETKAPVVKTDDSIDSIDRSISKFMSLILRHQPKEFGLTLDTRGFVSLLDLTAAIQTKKPWITELDVRRVAESSEKQRFEIISSMIRARYGHSVPVAFDEDEIVPPEHLYHGTSGQALESLRNEGLKGMGRQYVHLSGDYEEARQVGLRHDPNPVVLTIKALDAHNQGLKFYKTGPLFMTKTVPPEFIVFPEEPEL